MATTIPPFDIPYRPDCRLCTPTLFPSPRRSTPESLEEAALIGDLLGAGLHVHNAQPVGQRWPDAVLPLEAAIVEYDSFVYHSAPKDVREDLAKQDSWEAAGFNVIRVREQGLARVRPSDILLPARSYRRLPTAARAGIANQIVACVTHPAGCARSVTA